MIWTAVLSSEEGRILFNSCESLSDRPFVTAGPPARTIFFKRNWRNSGGTLERISAMAH